MNFGAAIGLNDRMIFRGYWDRNLTCSADNDKDVHTSDHMITHEAKAYFGAFLEAQLEGAIYPNLENMNLHELPTLCLSTCHNSDK